MDVEYVDPLNNLETEITTGVAMKTQREVMNVVQSYHNVAEYTAADIIAELLQNALDAIDASIAEDANRPRSVDVVLDCTENIIQVIDSGCGIEEDEAVHMLAPGRGTKARQSGGPRSRGYKGVGMTFLAYGYNDIEIVTHTPGGAGIAISLKGGRSWVESDDPKSVASRPIAEIRRPAKPVRPNGTPLQHGTSVRIRLDNNTRPKHLARAVLSAEMAATVLQRQSAAGVVNLNNTQAEANYDIHLHYTRDGDTQTIRVPARYRFPHEPVQGAVSSIAIGVEGEVSKGLRSAATARGLWHVYQPDQIVQLLGASDHEAAGKLFDRTERRQIEKQFSGGVDPLDPLYEQLYRDADANRQEARQRYVAAKRDEFVEDRLRTGVAITTRRIQCYAFFAGRRVRGEMQQAWGLGAREGDLTKYGYRISICGLITPILNDVGLRGEAGYRNNMWLVYDIGTHVDLDMGRKTLPRDVSDLIHLIDEYVSEDLKRRALTTGAVDLGAEERPVVYGSDDNERAKLFAHTKSRWEQHKDVNNWRSDLCVISPALQESDVINHFVALVQNGLLGMFQISQSFSAGTYDMLVVTVPGRLDPQRLPERTRCLHPIDADVVKVVEFKKHLSEIEADLADCTKVWSQMDIIVCWDIGNCETLAVEPTTKATNVLPGATHLAVYQQQALPVIAISELLELLKSSNRAP